MKKFLLEIVLPALVFIGIPILVIGCMFESCRRSVEAERSAYQERTQRCIVAIEQRIAQICSEADTVQARIACEQLRDQKREGCRKQ